MPRLHAAEEVSRQLWIALAFSLAIAFSMAFIDIPAAQLSQSHSSTVHWVMRKLTSLGDSSWAIPATALSALVAAIAALVAPQRLCHAWRNASLFVFISLCTSGIACVVLKCIVGRLRPNVLGVEDNLVFSPFTHSAQWASFPSGHTTTAMTLAFSLGLIFPRIREPLIAIAALVGLSRVVLGVHWVSDVLAGTWLAYLIVSLLAARLSGLLTRGSYRSAIA